MVTRKADTPLRIAVVRSGGFAGISRQWHIEADDAAAWGPLVEACPWGSVSVDTESRDRFVWRIEVRVTRRKRVASVPDRDLVGPWRELVERVQAESGSSAGEAGVSRPTDG
jgi:hypothetical protein